MGDRGLSRRSVLRGKQLLYMRGGGVTPPLPPLNSLFPFKARWLFLSNLLLYKTRWKLPPNKFNDDLRSTSYTKKVRLSKCVLCSKNLSCQYENGILLSSSIFLKWKSYMPHFQSSFSRPGDRSIVHLPDLLQDDLPGYRTGLPSRALPSTRPPFSFRPRLLLQTGKQPQINQRLRAPIQSPWLGG